MIETLVFIVIIALFYGAAYSIGNVFNAETNNLLREILKELRKTRKEATNE